MEVVGVSFMGGGLALFLSLFFFFFNTKKLATKAVYRRAGGFYLALIFLLMLVVGYLSGVTEGWGLLLKDFVSLFFIVLIALVMGAWDDKKKLGVSWQLLGQFLIAMVVVLAGDLFYRLRLPWDGAIELNYWVDVFLTTAWVVLVINSFNWIDGIDGVAGGVSLVSLFFLFLLGLGLASNGLLIVNLVIILFGLVLGFWFFNLKGKIYLGSAGTTFLGAMLAVIALYSGGKVLLFFLAISVPLLDFLIVVTKRLKQGRKPWLGGDSNHLHDRLLKKGYSKKMVVLIYMLLALLLGLAASCWEFCFGLSVICLLIFLVIIIMTL